MTLAEFQAKYDAAALHSQDACNASGLLHSAFEMLCDWKTVKSDQNGHSCDHLKMLLYQINFLVFEREMTQWIDWFDVYREIRDRLSEK